MENIIETLVSSLGVPLTAVIVTAIGMVAVYVFMTKKVKSAKSESDSTIEELKKENAVLTQRIFTCEKRLDEGNEHFDRMDISLRTLNSSIERLSGMVEMFFRTQGVGGGK